MQHLGFGSNWAMQQNLIFVYQKGNSHTPWAKTIMNHYGGGAITCFNI
jgi:hypothetical protein